MRCMGMAEKMSGNTFRKKCPKLRKFQCSPIAAESTSTQLQISQINVEELLCIQFNFEVKWTLFEDDRKKSIIDLSSP
jgi:hypothetical protein